MPDRAAAEARRLEEEYRRRDAARDPFPRLPDAGTTFHLLELEWQLHAALRRADVPLAGAAVLDVGCGTGERLQRLRELGAAEAVGLDLLESRVALGRELHPGLDLRQGNAAEMPFTDGSFDVVTQFVSLSSILDPVVRGAALREMWRVTRPGGIVVHYDLRATPRAVRGLGRLVSRSRAADTPTRPLSPAEIRDAQPGELRAKAVSLNLVLARAIVPRSRALAILLQALPPLRTHLLAVVRKPPG